MSGKDKFICSHCGKEFMGLVRKNSINRFCTKKCENNYKIDRTIERFGKGLVSHSGTLKRISVMLFGSRCSICGIQEWQGQTVPLVLDHIDGDSSNNYPDNLRLVCGNCDMQLPTYKSKNRGKGRHSRKIRYAKGQSY